MADERYDYSKTLNLPKTDFPMRGNLPEREPYILSKMEEGSIYQKALVKNERSGKRFILHDGPPYANGDIHTGHALNKVLKDIIVRYKTMNGFYAPYIPGWDTHGLPIERKVQEVMAIKRDEIGAVKFRDLCRDFALKAVENQVNQFKRLGGVGDYANRYVTLNPEFEANQVEVFGEMYKRGYIYRGLKPVYWCRDCETALAEAEIEYNDDKAHTIYVKFRVKEDKNDVFKDVGNIDDIYFVIWTTTAWTLPGNQAITINKDFDYALVEYGGSIYIIANELVSSVMKEANIENYEIIKTIKGEKLEGVICKHPFLDKTSQVIVGNEYDLNVKLDAGTGCVHTAPGHGYEDYMACKRYENIEITVPVDSKGYMTEEAGIFSGLSYNEASKKIIDFLRETGYLLADKVIEHSYPHCWRCRQPVIYRATTQWFASIAGFRDKVLKQVKNVKWYPSWGEERMTNMIKDRSDWCISRQRVWGVPIPIFYCNSCGKELVTDGTINVVKELFREKGSRAWFEMDANEMLKYRFTCENCGHQDFSKEQDIMDVWFDSGTTYAGVIDEYKELSFPADMYLEGNDQYRGWFQSSLLTSVATRNEAPYKEVLTHGWVVDKDGKKMSKSLGNGIDPLEIVNKYGADILRLWSISSDYHNDVRLSDDILIQVSEVYKKIRNTARFLLGNLYDFAPDTNYLNYEYRDELDKCILMELNNFLQKVNDAYETYDFHEVYILIHKFCTTELSSGYLDIVKDRLYTLSSDSLIRRTVQSTLYDILLVLTKVISPILVFTSEEIWGYMRTRSIDSAESILLTSWPKVKNDYINEEMEQKWEKINIMKEKVTKALEKAREEKVIGHSLNAKVTIAQSGDKYMFFKDIEELLTTVLIVSQVEVVEGREKITISKADGDKCERCWTYSTTVGSSRVHPTICKKCLDNVK